jgi:hypothetical protein
MPRMFHVNVAFALLSCVAASSDATLVAAAAAACKQSGFRHAHGQRKAAEATCLLV